MVAACASAGPAAPPTPEGTVFAYTVPEPPTVTYEVGDTTVIAMSTGGVPLRIAIGYRGVLELVFDEGRDGGVLVSVGVRELDGRFTSPMAGEVAVGPEDISGPIRVELARDGRIEGVRLPELSQAFVQVAGSDGVVRSLFAHLPERPAHPGATWTDTVRISEGGDGMTTTGLSVIESTWAADTVDAGRPLHVIRTRTDNTLTISGATGGTAMEQRLVGETRGRVLWDPIRGLLVERREEGTLSGVLRLPETGGQNEVPLEAVVRRYVRLQD